MDDLRKESKKNNMNVVKSLEPFESTSLEDIAVQKDVLNAKSRSNWVVKFRRFEKMSKHYTFNVMISNSQEYMKAYDSEIEIKHLKCGRKFKMILSRWTNLHTTNKIVVDECGTHLCIYCAQDKKNSQFQKALNSKYGKEFLLSSNFYGVKKKVALKHLRCGKTFDIVPSNYSKYDIVCKECNEESLKCKMKNIKKKNKELKEYLKEHGLVNYIPLEDSQGVSKRIMFKSKKCGHEFKKSAYELRKYSARKECPKCKDLRYKSSSQSDRNDYYQDRLKDAHGDNYILVSDYFGQGSDVTVKHVKCSNEIQVNSETIRKKIFKCPHCELGTLKYSKYISIKEKIRIYEEELDGKYNILTPFLTLKDVVEIRHNQCGHEFKATMNTLMKSKKHEICPECKKRDRLNHALERLKSIHGIDFILLNPEDFENTQTILNFKHIGCGAVLERNFNYMWSVTVGACSECSSFINTTEKLKSYVYKRFKGEYYVAGDYNNSNTPIKFRHKNCGRAFHATVSQFRRRKSPCLHCGKVSRALTIKEAQQKVNEKHGELFKLCGEYKNMHVDMPIMCNSCGSVFELSVSSLLKITGCSQCVNIEKDEYV